MKHYTPEQVQALPLPELRLAVADRLPFSYYDESGLPNVMPDWTSDLNACAVLKVPGYDLFVRIFTDPPDIPDVSYAIAEYFEQNLHYGVGRIFKASGATEAEARCRAWLAAMQEPEPGGPK